MNFRKLILFLATAGVFLAAEGCSKNLDYVTEEEEKEIIYPADTSFINNWENKQVLKIIQSTGVPLVVNTPWNKQFRSSTIPQEIAEDVCSKDGWEVAFNTTGVEGLPGASYFGLYNYRLGILRVFAYLETAIGSGNECSFEVNVGPLKSSALMYPMYNALPYAIPTRHNQLNMYMNFFGYGIGDTFKQIITPYRVTLDRTESTGWTCFDVDMSGYNPNSSVLWPTKDPSQMFHINGCNRESASISLSGTVSAKTSGKFTEQIPVKSTNTSGVASLFKSLGQSASGGLGQSILKFIGGFIGSDLASPAKTLATILQITGSITDELYKDVMKGTYDPATAQKVIDGMKGKIEMTTTGDVNLSGYLQKSAVSSYRPIDFGNSAVHTSNPSSHFGNGVWGLAEDPVVYLVEDVMTGEKNRVNLFRSKGSKTYGNREIESYGLKMVQFVDPTTLKVNVNTDVFKGLDSVNVSYFYGVYPKEKRGHTSQYVSLLKLDRPKVTIFKDENTVRYDSRTPGNNIIYYQMPASNLMVSSIGETTQNFKATEKQTDANYRYHGYEISDYGKPFIMDPLVYFPITVQQISSSIGKVSLYDGECPDFVLFVTISFRYAGHHYYFSERYLPQVKLIKRKDLPEKLKELNAYADKCRTKKPINTLNNNSSCIVLHPTGDKAMERSIRILEKIK